MVAHWHSLCLLIFARVVAVRLGNRVENRALKRQLTLESHDEMSMPIKNSQPASYAGSHTFSNDDNTGKGKTQIAVIVVFVVLVGGGIVFANRKGQAWVSAAPTPCDLTNKGLLGADAAPCDSTRDGASSLDPLEDENKANFLDTCRDAGALNAQGNYVGFFHDPFALKDFQKDQLTKFLPRVCFALVFNTLCLYLNNVSQAQLQQSFSGYYESGKNPTGMWDLAFKELPRVASTKPGDFLALCLPAIGFVRLIVIPGPLSFRWIILNRIFLIWGLLWLARASFMWFTILPSPDPTCIPRVSFPGNCWMEAFANLHFMKWRYDELTCMDMMFSGHAMVCTLYMLGVLWYTPVCPWTYWSASHKWFSIDTLSNSLCFGLLLLEYYLLSASRFHYTLDVVVGASITIMVFFGYHYFLQNACLCDVNPSGLLYKFIQWYEYHSSDMRLWRRRAAGNLKTLAEKGSM